MESLATSQAALSRERETAELREQFIAVLGHDLRNPLAAIGAGAELLARTPLNDRATRMVAVIQKSVARMSGLIDDVLDFARGRLGGGLAVHSIAEPLEPVLRHVIAELHTRFPDRELDIDLAVTRPVKCDQARIGQLLSNLVANAMTYGAPDQPVRIRASSADEWFELSVANAGEPIPPAALERLFQPFERGTVRPSQQGLGLGLYIAVADR